MLESVPADPPAPVLLRRRSRPAQERSHDPEPEREIAALGRRLATVGRSLRRTADDRAMALAMRDPQVRAALFRLVDVAPACATPAELATHLDSFLAQVERPAPAVRLARRAAAGSALTGRVARGAVHAMAGRFIVGATPAQASGALRRLWLDGCAASVDLLGEATVTRAEGAAYAARCEEALAVLTRAAAGWPQRPLLEADGLGPLPRVNLSVKVTALTPLVRAQAPRRGRDDAAGHLRGLLRRARDLGAHLHVDMESLDARELVLDLVLELLAEPEFAAGPSAGIVMQAYLVDAEETVARVLDWARATPRAQPLTIRLVKGAYWDHETIEAAQHGWVSPVWTEKAESDRCFERIARTLIAERAGGLAVRPAIASHNLRSVAHAIVHARRAGLGAADLELQVLRGLGDDLAQAVAREGLRPRVYAPVGDLVAGMAYLVRRLLENSSNDSFLASRTSGTDLDRLLSAP